MALSRPSLALGALLLAGPAFAAGPEAAQTPVAKPETKPSAAKDEPLIYIFSGVVGGGETYSGTLVATPDGPQFELKLAKGTTCDATKLEPDKGLLRLPETTCSDGRKLKALFVYQNGGFLRVYGSIGDERFSTEAHSMSGTAESEPKPSAAPPANLMTRPK